MIILFLIVSQVLSILFLIVSVRRLYAYIRIYKFDESIYHHLFGLMHVSHIVLFYIFAVGFSLGIGIYSILIL